jgi:hypothetical protein
MDLYNYIGKLKRDLSEGLKVMGKKREIKSRRRHIQRKVQAGHFWCQLIADS